MANVRDFHATVKKAADGCWVYRVFADWKSKHPVLVARGAYHDWATAVTVAIGSVIAHRLAYEQGTA